MYRILNYVNRKWNNCVFLFHDLATKTRIGWLVKLSIWAHDKAIWELPERLQLIGGVPVYQLRLERELEIAKHQAEYWSNYAGELQEQIFNAPDADSEEPEVQLVPLSTDG